MLGLTLLTSLPVCSARPGAQHSRSPFALIVQFPARKKLQKLFDVFATKFGYDVAGLDFSLDGQILSGDQLCAEVGIINGSQLDVTDKDMDLDNNAVTGSSTGSGSRADGGGSLGGQSRNNFDNRAEPPPFRASSATPSDGSVSHLPSPAMTHASPRDPTPVPPSGRVQDEASEDEVETVAATATRSGRKKRLIHFSDDDDEEIAESPLPKKLAKDTERAKPARKPRAKKAPASPASKAAALAKSRVKRNENTFRGIVKQDVIDWVRQGLATQSESEESDG